MLDEPRRPAPPLFDERSALFLDVDGTLVEFDVDPRSVRPTAALRALLVTARDRLDGALALVSGRTLLELDAMFAPTAFTAAGLHGHELRVAPAGDPRGSRGASSVMRALALDARAWSRAHPGVLVEDKGLAVALHYRAAPEAREAVESYAARAAAEAAGHRLQLGDHVAEIVPAGGDKGRAVEELMMLAPFRGRTPIFVGDDLTDEYGFAVARRLDGFGVLVGPRRESDARHGLPRPRDVEAWIEASVRSISDGRRGP